MKDGRRRRCNSPKALFYIKVRSLRRLRPRPRPSALIEAVLTMTLYLRV